MKHLADTSDAASDHVLQILTADRYLALLDALVETARQPHFSSERPGLADRGARSVLGDLALKPWRRLDRAVDNLAPDAPDAALHAVRILAKRARYAADAVVPLYGKDARRFARALADVQTVLGQYQDTTVAEAWLRSAAKALPTTRWSPVSSSPSSATTGCSCALEFRKVWKKASRKKLRKFLR